MYFYPLFSVDTYLVFANTDMHLPHISCIQIQTTGLNLFIFYNGGIKYEQKHRQE
jgi:hypothetical protein